MVFIAVLTVLLFCGYATVIIYYSIKWRSFKAFAFATNEHSTPVKITIIIPARNEENNISKCLDSICQQKYPASHRQVIVVDDHSTDGTAAAVKSFSAEHVVLIRLKDFVTNPINSYKKKAIDTAMQFATGELIITTDADCIAPEKWLETIASFYQQHQPAFIAMPVQFTATNSPIQIFQALDFMTLQGITAASVSAGSHSMCNGANLAYTKMAFEAVNGFEGIDNIASGDDMLLMHKIAERFPGKIAFIKSPEVIVKTAPMPDLRSFLNQRIRWASKADKYDDKRIIAVLFLVYFFNVLLLLLPAVSIFYNPFFAGSLSLAWILAVDCFTENDRGTDLSFSRGPFLWQHKDPMVVCTRTTISHPLHRNRRLPGQIWKIQLERQDGKIGPDLTLQSRRQWGQEGFGDITFNNP